MIWVLVFASFTAVLLAAWRKKVVHDREQFVRYMENQALMIEEELD